jgi:hypothetical protein
MYATPVVYAIPQEGLMKTLMELNLTPLVLTARDLIVDKALNIYCIIFWIMLICIPQLGLVFYRISFYYCGTNERVIPKERRKREETRCKKEEPRCPFGLKGYQREIIQ